MNSQEILDREFLEIRAKLLEVAASFDRIERAEGDVAGDPRSGLFREALEILQGDSSEKAEQLQLLFSRTYDDGWPEKFDLVTSK
jgi:hypothetical protein